MGRADISVWSADAYRRSIADSATARGLDIYPMDGAWASEAAPQFVWLGLAPSFAWITELEFQLNLGTLRAVRKEGTR